MKDPHDRKTINLLGESNMATVRVNYGYKGNNNKLRQGALIIEAIDAKTAVKVATDQLNKEHDWFHITGTVTYQQKKE